MNIVIANAPCYLDNGKGVILFPSRWDSGVNGKPLFHFYPWELATLSALLKRELPDHNITMLDPNIMGWNGDRTIQEISKLKPDVLICELSALTYPTMTRVMRGVFDSLQRGVPFLRRHDYHRTILCGPMAHDAERAYADGWTDCVVGEYELRVLAKLSGKQPPDEAYTHGLINLDWLPWPEDVDLDRSKYREINHYIDYKSNDTFLQLYATRGCPLSCTFCVVPSYYGGHGNTSRSHRCRDVNDVCDEIEYLAACFPNTKGFYLNEESHNANTKWFALFCEELIRRGLNKYQYDAMSLMAPWTPELVQLAKRAGYRQIRFGLESTSEQVGKAIKKTVAKDKTERFLGWLKDAGIGAYATAQVGAMGSTEESDRASIADIKDWIQRGMIQKWQLSTSTPQINTPFWNLCVKNGYLTTTNPEDFDGYRATCNFPGYSAAQIQHVRDTCGL